MTIEVTKPGMMTTVQDRGRKGWQRYGVTVGGAMDEVSFRLANGLVGNSDGAAALEMTFAGAAFVTLKEVVLAVCGADMEGTVDGEPLPMNRPVFIPQGRTVRFGAATDNCRTMVAFAGGIALPELLGSRSAALRSGFDGPLGRPVRSGDRLETGALTQEMQRSALQLWNRMDRLYYPSWFIGDEWREPGIRNRSESVYEIRVVPGCEWDRFTEDSLYHFQNDEYKILPQSDRMGVRLSGTALQTAKRESMLSDAVTMGTVQVPPDGQPIVLMADRQTTGGYPRIGQVASVDLPKFSQARPGRSVRFRLISAEEAEKLYMARERDLDIVLAALSLKRVREKGG